MLILLANKEAVTMFKYQWAHKWLVSQGQYMSAPKYTYSILKSSFIYLILTLFQSIMPWLNKTIYQVEENKYFPWEVWQQ